MKFGHVSGEEIGNVDFTLPDDHPESFFSGISHPDPKIFVGCGKWGIPEWVGPLYPEGTKEKDYLSQYVQKFNSIELNGTFYRLSRSSLEKWAEEASGHDFQYCPKWSQRISHFKRLDDVEENTRYFIDSVALLGDHLGCSFMTLPPNFGPKHIQRVNDFINLIPEKYPAQIEFRHKDWFEASTFKQLASALRERQLGAVITDVALRRDVLHMCLTTETAFIRFNGYALHPTDFMRLDSWVDRLERWIKKGVAKIYFFMHQQNEEHTIVLCDYFINKINDRLGLNLPALNLQK
ncbi:MAG: DUF72 domain-containing protein [Saprospiraceae bacterium]|nr:DUF72 domain-containing protein [Saprospiraceae bacterium]